MYVFLASIITFLLSFVMGNPSGLQGQNMRAIFIYRIGIDPFWRYQTLYSASCEIEHRQRLFPLPPWFRLHSYFLSLFEESGLPENCRLLSQSLALEVVARVLLQNALGTRTQGEYKILSQAESLRTSSLQSNPSLMLAWISKIRVCWHPYWIQYCQ